MGGRSQKLMEEGISWRMNCVTCCEEVKERGEKDTNLTLTAMN